MVADLMPVGSEAPRCSEFARNIGLLPPGTGLFLERVVVVSTPLPWPKPALKHSLLAPIAAAVNAAPVNARLFAAEPGAGDEDGLWVEVYDRTDTGASLHRWRARPSTDTARFQQALHAIVNAPLGQLSQAHVPELDLQISESESPDTVLICTQDSHDVCCGVAGVELADELHQTRPELRVRRVSHTGGHRFAPTLLAFPEGRMWAYADHALIERILSDSTTSTDHRRHDRGWWGARTGPMQAAECAVRAELAPGAPTVATIVAIDSDDESHLFDVTVRDRTFRADVRVGRAVPTVACEAPGGLPAKPGREFVAQVTST